MDEIVIEKLKVSGKHGCEAIERQVTGNFEVSMRLFADLNAAAKTDSLDDTIDYPAAMAIVEGVFAGESVRLIEKLADLVAQRMFERFQKLSSIEVEVAKIGVKVGYDFSQISVKINRDRSFYLK